MLPCDPAASPAREIFELLATIELAVRFGPVATTALLPGIAISDGDLLVDLAQLAYPGDLLHEAGHLAVTPLAERTRPNVDDAGNEMAAIAWSYAAALHIGIDPAVVFHPAGYKGGAASILDNFSQRRTFGVPLLAWFGLTREDLYPRMLRWTRE